MKGIAFAIVLSTTIALPAFAQGTSDSTQGRSRAEVKKELAKSKHDGTYTKKNGEYPPSEQTVKQQKADHAASMHSKDGANPAFDKHDEPGAAR
ncbi:uncharacterized protein DUF4148 [Cupriavidus metallidurans]|uniref:DUF4148 domain-containing protein n=2 Tax=Cupriavidus TaxID=106589 RepID=A0A3G8GW66_9BURK|nr:MULTISPECIES: DUF4148 domain-containing protein [Cupriavidus]AZG12200.1 DUF4148 domain-containing protein [Cupriavidus pauculus]KAB0595812.1 DUF4148 domain-containing protein [Cupriavidus pauculus]MDE4922487.1 DUF4148 domain-containing protein [Cupriavidus metallidurans]QBP14303.1 DUF4148 domain-containing protein [Cupriavidus metallidurans]UAL02615.1 DUF4148 domain-containing protein [Cupriavidus pauculus]